MGFRGYPLPIHATPLAFCHAINRPNSVRCRFEAFQDDVAFGWWLVPAIHPVRFQYVCGGFFFLFFFLSIVRDCRQNVPHFVQSIATISWVLRLAPKLLVCGLCESLMELVSSHGAYYEPRVCKFVNNHLMASPKNCGAVN